MEIHDIRPRNRPTKCRDEILRKCQPNGIFMECKTWLPVYIFFFFTSIVKKLYILSENKNSFQSLEIEIKTFGNIHCVNVLRDKGIIFFFFFTFRQ